MNISVNRSSSLHSCEVLLGISPGGVLPSPACGDPTFSPRVHVDRSVSRSYDTCDIDVVFTWRPQPREEYLPILCRPTYKPSGIFFVNDLTIILILPFILIVSVRLHLSSLSAHLLLQFFRCFLLFHLTACPCQTTSSLFLSCLSRRLEIAGNSGASRISCSSAFPLCSRRIRMDGETTFASLSFLYLLFPFSLAFSPSFSSLHLLSKGLLHIRLPCQRHLDAPGLPLLLQEGSSLLAKAFHSEG